jgi:hypothetical protein
VKRKSVLIEPPVLQAATVSNLISYSLESLDALDTVEKDQLDTDRALNLSVALDDLHVVVNRIKEPTATDVALMQCVANTAVSGTDMSATSVLPSMESFGNKQVFVNSLASRSGDVLNMFVHQVSEKLGNLESYIKTTATVVRESKIAVTQLDEKFPIPGGDYDDVPRTIEVVLKDCQFLITPIGVALTQGDILNAFKWTAVNFKTFTEVATPTTNRLMQTIREVIPKKRVASAAELLEATKFSNSSLYMTVLDLWTNMISASRLNVVRSGDSPSTASTDVLLGNQALSIGIVANSMKINDGDISLSDKSELIRSLKATLQDNAGYVVPEQKVTITGVTNAGIRSLISNLTDFTTDLEKYAAWSNITAQVGKNQCESDIATISNFFSQEATGEMSEQEAEDYRNYLYTHIGDLNSVVKATVQLTSLPLTYGSKLISDFIILLSAMPGDKPVGAYNSL